MIILSHLRYSPHGTSRRSKHQNHKTKSWATERIFALILHCKPILKYSSNDLKSFFLKLPIIPTNARTQLIDIRQKLGTQRFSEFH